MTIVSSAIGAVSSTGISWHSINWKKAHRTVKRLQARIVKATKEGRWNKVKALQHLLTHSFSAKAIAVKRVTDNQGKNTPGVDKEIWNTPAKKANAVDSLKRKGYKPLPLRRITIPKPHNPNKKRPLSIPCMRDRGMQALYLQALDPIVEIQADPNSYGFRMGRSCADAIEQCFNVLARKPSAQWILEGDIRACFDKISHRWLEEHIPMDKQVLRKWLKSGFIQHQTFYPTIEGTPQGSIISPTMCNLTLSGLEKELRTWFAPHKFPANQNPKVNLIVYADDFVVTGSSQEILVTQVKPLIVEFLAQRGLELSEEKTKITHIEEGFDFLGQTIRKYRGKLLIKPSKKSVKQVQEKLREVVQKNKQAKTGKLIELLNPIIRGWTNYHRHVVSKKTFNSLDSAIFKMIWQWAKRRHPNKPRKWIKDNYFQIQGKDQWGFFAKTENGKTIRLLKAGKVAIQRHTKIKSEANPYDPDYEEYFERRLAQKFFKAEKTRGRLRGLWKSQNGKCPICDQTITTETGWNIHHIHYRANGGNDKMENLILLHPNCHRQVHCLGLTVLKPDPQ